MLSIYSAAVMVARDHVGMKRGRSCEIRGTLTGDTCQPAPEDCIYGAKRSE